jgi:hypothetical protein
MIEKMPFVRKTAMALQKKTFHLFDGLFRSAMVDQMVL